ncbi:hypothetical protein [Peribacillus butanolivorans]
MHSEKQLPCWEEKIKKELAYLEEISQKRELASTELFGLFTSERC